MNRALVLFVFAGVVALASAAGPCVPPQHSTEFILTMSSPGLGEHGILAVDFTQSAFAANVSGIVVSNSSEPQTFQGTFLWINGTGYWISGGDCSTSPFGVPGPLLHQCFPAGGNYSYNSVATIPSVTYSYAGPTNATTFTYTLGSEALPISLTFLDFQSEWGPSNSTSVVYFNGKPYVDPNVFVIPSECNNARAVRKEAFPVHVTKMMGINM